MFVCAVQVVVADGHTFERLAIEKWLMRHDTNPLTGTALASSAPMYPSLALRDATRAWEMEHGRSPAPRPSPLRPSPGAPYQNGSPRTEFGEDEEEGEEEGEEYGEEYGEEDEGQGQYPGENEDTVTAEAMRQRADAFTFDEEAFATAVQQNLDVAVGASEQTPRDAAEDERLINLGREIVQSRARYEARLAAITPSEREASLERHAARMAERERAVERYEQWQRRQELQQAAGARWLAELAEQRESELAATAEAAAERLTAPPFRQSHTEEPQGVRPPPAARSIPRLLPGDVVRLGGLSGPRGEELNGRSSTGSKCRRALYPRSHAGWLRAAHQLRGPKRAPRAPAPHCVHILLRCIGRP